MTSAYHFDIIDAGEAPDEDVHVDQSGLLCKEREWVVSDRV